MSFTEDLRSAIGEQHPLSHHCSTRTECTEEIKAGGASFHLDDSPIPHLIASFDKPPLHKGSKERCDFLFAADRGDNKGWMAFIEMTSGEKNIEKAARQLEGGMKITQDTIAMPEGYAPEYRFVLVGKVSKPRRLKLRPGKKAKIHVPFQDSKSRIIRIIENGGRLSEALTIDP